MSKNPIPLERQQDWWWYVAKGKLLKFIISKNFEEKNINKILEIGPGLGNNIKILSEFGKVDILETEIEFTKYLQENFNNYIDSFYSELKLTDKNYDLIVMLDVLEHIKDSELFMKNLEQNLSSNGRLIVGVPAYMKLWSNHDVELKHYRRYDWNSLEKDCIDYEIVKKYGFNFLLLPIRFFQLKFLKNIHSTYETSKAINTFFVFVSNIENLLRSIKINPKFGLSLYALLAKKVN